MCHAWACLDGVCVWGIENFNNVFCFITGKDDTLPPSASVTQSVVLELSKGLENRGHHLFCDNYYTGVPLFSSLHDLGFGACGTVSQQEGCAKRTYNHQAGKGRGTHCTDRGRHPGTEVDGQTTSHPSQYHPRRHHGHQGSEDAAGPWGTGGDQQATHGRGV